MVYFDYEKWDLWFFSLLNLWRGFHAIRPTYERPFRDVFPRLDT